MRTDVFDSTTSADGTIIGYRSFGAGPPVVLLHGGLMASQNFVKLGEALANDFTVHIPDRRGRGRSGPFRDDHSIARDGEDLAAVMRKTGSAAVFGLSSGAVIVLFAAMEKLAPIAKIALFEPPLLGPDATYLDWVSRYEREIDAGKLGSALVTIIKGTGDPGWLRELPRALLVPALALAIRLERRKGWLGEARLGTLVPTFRYDARIVRETQGPFERYRNIDADVLVMSGGRSTGYLQDVANALERVIPGAQHVRFGESGHLAADNEGIPERVADELRTFFR